MSEMKTALAVKQSWISVDTLAVLIALLAAILIRAGIVQTIPW